MNIHKLIAVFWIFCAGAHAQTAPCDGGRYIDPIFPQVKLTSGIIYGEAITASGQPQTLLLDVYEPEGDPLPLRPLIVIAHGGSFAFGTRNMADMQALGNHFAKRGYVVASISYRLGYDTFFPNASSATRTVMRATHDMRAAVRFFRKDFSENNLYRVDTAAIYAGGVSAGAFMALHLAYLDQVEEVPAAIDLNAVGGLEGTSGNPGYSSKVKGVINLCGAIGDTAWIVQGDVPLISMHGTNDDVVPYNTSMLYLISIPVITVSGSSSIHAKAQLVGIHSSFYSWQGAGHTPFIGNPAYMDSVFQFVTPRLAQWQGCDVPLATTHAAIVPSRVFPNPAQDFIFIHATVEAATLEIFNLQGQRLCALQVETEKPIQIGHLSPGIYIARWGGNTARFIKQ